MAIPADKIIESLEAQDFIDKPVEFFEELVKERRKQIQEGYR